MYSTYEIDGGSLYNLLYRGKSEHLIGQDAC